ncbi:MAG: hypothetical protein V8Q27_09905 [Eubacteriales bacterium]
MFAQTMLTISLILPVFSGIRKRRLPGFLLLLGASLFFLSYIATPDSLYVDTLLPLCGAFGFLLLNRELEVDEHTAWLTVLPAAAVIMIKNSGIFFWALIAGRVLIYWIRHRKTASSMQRRSWLTVMLFPLFSLLVWNRHVAYVFTSAESSPHSMSLSVYLANIQAKLADGTIHRLPGLSCFRCCTDGFCCFCWPCFCWRLSTPAFKSFPVPLSAGWLCSLCWSTPLISWAACVCIFSPCRRARLL